MPSGLVYGASYGHAYLFSPPVARLGGGTGRGARGLPEDRYHAPEVRMERSPVPDSSPPSPPPPASATAPADTPGPSYTV